MQIEVVTGAIQEQEAQAIVVNLFQDVKEPGGATGAVDKALNGQIQALIDSGDFKGKPNEVVVLYPSGAIPAKRVILVGLGKVEKFKFDTIRQAAGTAANKARALGVTHLHTIVHGAGTGDIAPEKATEAVVEGTMLALYRFHELKRQTEKDAQPDVEKLTLVEFDADLKAVLEKGARAGKTISEAVAITRNLVNRPANIATPGHLGDEAMRVARQANMLARVLTKEAVDAIGMRSFLSVASASGAPACLIQMEHNAGRDDLPTVVLVGKGITFDSGGISLKPSLKMERMKGDMAGGAAVIGAMHAVGELDLPLHVIALVPATENMPDAHANKPGDVVHSLKGITIEIINTDAEGRLILVDALTYAREFEPDAIFDIATLTGAREIALGAHAAAVMGDEQLIEQLRSAGETTYERVWQLPLYEEYAEQLKSTVADVQNIGGRPAGTITAGVFLSKFVPEDVPWVHIDIAGLELINADQPYAPKGATGFGTRLLVEVLRNWEA